MMICHSEKFIFIHVPKVSGTSIKDVLARYLYKKQQQEKNSENASFTITPNLYYPPSFSNSYPEHITAKELKQQISGAIFNSYFKFAFVRNPWDWIVSNYFFFLQDKKGTPAYDFIEKKKFSEVIKYFLQEEKPELIADMRFSQKEFLYDDAGNLLVDYVGKYESMDQSFGEVCNTIGIEKVKLPRLNQSQHKPYEHYYDDALREFVYTALIDDFKIFGY